ncbi:MAG: outer membrane lipoprotein chaperone LolA [Pseudoxanthomonas sp.]
MIRMLRCALLATTLLAASAHAGARADLAAFAGGLKGLDGEFTQKVYTRNGQVKETSSGRVALSVPRLFRWEYRKPYQQLIVADGAKVWIYEPDLEQVTVRAQGAEEQNSPLAALLDPAGLDKRFDVSEGPDEAGIAWMTLTPKRGQDASFEVARLGFAAGQLARMEVTDGAGQRTELEFSGWKRNPAFAGGAFKYAPPAGVDVVGDGQ